MNVAVVRFPGSNCDDDAYHVVGRVMGQPVRFAWHKDTSLGATDAEGRFVHPNVAQLEKEGRVVFRYVDPAGGATDAANPNGSQANIAGTCNARGNVVGLMPHPERAAEAILGSDDGKMLFASLL